MLRRECQLLRTATMWAAAWSVLGAKQLPAQRATIPPIRPIGAVIARARDSIATISQLLALSDGRVVINDPFKKRLFMLDSSLANLSEIADTSSETNKAYGGRGGTAFLYRADTVLYVDAASEAFLVINPAGKIVRVMAFPRPEMARVFGLGAASNAGIDPAGRLVYRPFGGRTCGDPWTQDSTQIVRTDIVTRKTDTLGLINYDKCASLAGPRDASGGLTAPPLPRVLPFQKADSWQLLSDGTVAFVRAQDFTIDWVDPDGTRRTTPRIPHDWVHLADSNKQALVDSLRVFYQAHPMHQSGGYAGSDGQMHPYTRDTMPTLPDPASLPDYVPAFTDEVKADLNGNLWIREAPRRSIVPPLPGTPTPPEPAVYDVITRLGQLIDRVQLPGGTTLVAFGPGGVAYLTSREGSPMTPVTSLVRVRVR